MSTLLGAAIGTGHLALGLIAIAAFWLLNDERGNLVIFFERGSAWQPGLPPRLFRDGEAGHQRFHAYHLGRVGWIPWERIACSDLLGTFPCDVCNTRMFRREYAGGAL